MVRSRLNVLSVLALALAACSDGSEPTQALRSEVRDSAGSGASGNHPDVLVEVLGD